jgi:hypothetical protein
MRCVLSATVIACALAAAPPYGAAPTAAAQTPSSGQSGGRSGSGKGASNSGMPANMTCEQISAASRGAITVEACKQMMGAQQANEAALADPRASRPGDDKMTCDQIAAEFKQQSITPPDKAKVAEAQAAASDLQATLAKQQKEVAEHVAAQSATNVATTVADAFAPNAVLAAKAKKTEEENKKFGERLAAESAPKEQRATDATANIMSDMGKQLTANPRMARLIQLAMQKSCKMQ